MQAALSLRVFVGRKVRATLGIVPRESAGSAESREQIVPQKISSPEPIRSDQGDSEKVG
jgi:hypothetical protein